MALPACSICGQNEAIMTLTDFSDGSTVTPCVVHFGDLVEYVVGVATAIEEALALPADAPLGPPDESPESEPKPEPTPKPSPPTDPPESRNGRTPKKSVDPPTDIGDNAETPTSEPALEPAE